MAAVPEQGNSAEDQAAPPGSAAEPSERPKDPVATEAPSRIAKLAMLLLSVQALLAAAMGGLTVLVMLSLVFDPLAVYDTTFVTQAGDDLDKLANYVQWPTALAFVTWLYFAIGTNQRRGRKKKYGPGWAAGAFVIPIASLVLPYLVMSEVFDNAPRTRDSTRRSLVAGWWGSFLVMRFFDAFSTFATMGYDSDSIEDLMVWNGVVLVGNAIWLGAALLAVLLVREVTRRQTWTRDTERLAEVFA